MSGFGTTPFGSEPFGVSLSTPHGPRGAFVPAAPEYDGNAQDLAVDADGRHRSIHPIDSGVQLAMFVQKRELPSSPDTGNELLSLREIGTPRQTAEIESVVRNANPIARYLREGSITIRRIDSEIRTSTGAVMVTLHYVNEVTRREETARSNT
jgi:hypothetical protein